MTKLRAISWASVSSLPQVAEDKISIDEQLRLNAEWCAANNAEIIDTLVIPGHSRYESDLVELLADYAEQGIWAYHKIREHWKAKDFDVLVCYHDSRFGRSSTTYNYVAENVIRSGRRIFRIMNGGWLDASNASFGLALGSIAATTGVAQLVEGRKMGMKRRAQKGLPTSSGVPMSHILIRDEFGKAVKMVVDESKRRLFNDFYTLYVERRTSYSQIEKLLFSEFGHAAGTGLPYQPMRFYTLLTNPSTHGHSARHHRHKDGRYASTGEWIFKPGYPIPDGVSIDYNTHEAVWQGEQFEAIFAEFVRRKSIGRKAGGDQAHAFSGLVVCAECGYHLNYQRASPYSNGMRCMTKYRTSSTRSTCSQYKWLGEKKIRAWLHPRLEQLMATRDWDAFFSTPHAGQSPDLELQSVMDEITQTNRRILRMIDDQSKQSSASVIDLYEKKILTAGERLDHLNARLAELTHQSTVTHQSSQQREYTLTELIDMGLDTFWQLPPAQINQLLHRLMGNRRLEALEGRIISTRESRRH